MINIEQPQMKTKPDIIIIGVGGGGGNAVNTMIDYGVDQVKYIAANTDYQALETSKAPVKLQLGMKLTKGLGAGAIPEIGKKAAEESYEEIKKQLTGADMVFVTAGMGGGTGTGAAPIVAEIARELGALTVAVVTTPFRIEGKKKMDNALKGLEELKDNVDSYIVISNDKIIESSPKGTPIKKAFEKGNEVLKHALSSVVTIITEGGLINADFADVKTIMENKGRAHIGYGIARGENRAMESLKQALNSPLLETSIKGANHLLTYVAASEDKFSLDEFDEIGNAILDEVEIEPENIISACGYYNDGDDNLITIIIATDLPQDQEKSNFSSISSRRKEEKVEKENKDEEEVKTDSQDTHLKKSDSQVVDITEAKVKERRELNIPDFMKKR